MLGEEQAAARGVPRTNVERRVWIDARPEVVFQFLSDSERIAQWMGTPTTWDARPGGLLTIAVDGVHPVSGSFLEVDPPRRIVFTWGWELPEYGVPPGGSTVEIDLLPDGDGSVLHLRHHGIPGDPDENIEGWMPYLERLKSAVVTASPTRKDQYMSERSAALASAFEQANDAVIAALEGCSEDQVRTICEGEGWSVAVAAHHLATGHESLAGFVKMMANGEQLPAITMDMIHAGNAKHAEEFASVSRDACLTALRTNGAAAAALVHGLSDEQLDRSAPMTFAGGAPWSAADLIERVMIGHALDHGKSINAALARPIAV